MKILFVCGFLTVLSLAVAEVDLKKLSKECYDTSKANPEDVAKFIMGKLNPTVAMEPVKCHFKCIMEKLGLFKDGKLDEVNSIKILENVPALKDQKEDWTKSIMECKEQKAGSDCEMAFKLIACFKTYKSGEIFFNEVLAKL